jgi:hypothetical protein
VEDLDRQVVALLAQKGLRLLLLDDARAVVRVDDVVADLEITGEVLEYQIGVSYLVN